MCAEHVFLTDHQDCYIIPTFFFSNRWKRVSGSKGNCNCPDFIWEGKVCFQFQKGGEMALILSQLLKLPCWVKPSEKHSLKLKFRLAWRLNFEEGSRKKMPFKSLEEASSSAAAAPPLSLSLSFKSNYFSLKSFSGNAFYSQKVAQLKEFHPRQQCKPDCCHNTRAKAVGTINEVQCELRLDLDT